MKKRKVAEKNENMDEIYCKSEGRRDGNEILLCKTDQMLTLIQ